MFAIIAAGLKRFRCAMICVEYPANEKSYAPPDSRKGDDYATMAVPVYGNLHADKQFYLHINTSE